MQAESEYQRRNWKAAVDLLQSAGDNKRSLEILIEFEQIDEVVRIMRKLDKKQDEDSIKMCIEYFTKIQDYNSGKEALFILTSSFFVTAAQSMRVRYSHTLPTP